MNTPLSSSFFQQSAPDAARSLLGMRLVRCFSDGWVAGRIVETEAYSGPDDRASHASRKNPGRARIMFGPPGVIYVYKVYGLHVCLNVVTGPETTAGAVLLRAVEPLEGLDIMRRRRGDHVSDRNLARGPGNLTRAFGIDMCFNGVSIDNRELWIQAQQNDSPIESGPRVVWPMRASAPTGRGGSGSRNRRLCHVQNHKRQDSGRTQQSQHDRAGVLPRCAAELEVRPRMQHSRVKQLKHVRRGSIYKKAV